ncbi:MAG: SRPBCC domain-containing protein [Roseibium sp.]|uniref:SRPBCC family protein n=1 Tax=Roseibium sp. TaxID=1936156 RepID=UPI002633DCF0|nr:SRPBCC domain-containing protein [Roseibium sp.]MCV0427011.1 SRPBCC domain-containing protein [Roseibium sp.]
MSAGFSVRLCRILNAPPDRVWDAWTRPKLMRRWFCPLGMQVAELEADLRVGGTFRVVMDPLGSPLQPPPELGKYLVAYGRYQRVEKPGELEFTWAWEQRDEISRVRISITPVRGGTELVLCHDGLKDEASRLFHEDGWKPTLDNLELALKS